MNVEIELFPMPKPDNQDQFIEADAPPQFDIKKFYANIISFDEEHQFSEMLGIEGA